MSDFAQFCDAVMASQPPTRFGSDLLHGKSTWMLADYLDEVDKQVGEFDVFMRQLEHNRDATDTCSNGLFATWNHFVNAPEFGYGPMGHPHGWREFFKEYRGWFPGLWNDDPIWAMAEQYEDEVIRIYDWAVSCGAKPTTKRPVPAHQPPPPSETPVGQVKDVLDKALVIAGVVAGAYILRSLKGGGK